MIMARLAWLFSASGGGGILAAYIRVVQEKGSVECLKDVYITPFSGLLGAPQDALCSLTSLNQSRHLQIDRCAHSLLDKTATIT